MSWTPVEVELGKLPEFHEEERTYDLSAGGVVPENASEVLVYTFITSIGEGAFQRGYYEIYTSDGGNDYKQYMNVATGQAVNIVNSANLWIPSTPDRLLKIKLYHPTSQKSQKKSIAGNLAATDWSDVFILGFRC